MFFYKHFTFASGISEAGKKGTNKRFLPDDKRLIVYQNVRKYNPYKSLQTRSKGSAVFLSKSNQFIIKNETSIHTNSGDNRNGKSA